MRVDLSVCVQVCVCLRVYASVSMCMCYCEQNNDANSTLLLLYEVCRLIHLEAHLISSKNITDAFMNMQPDALMLPWKIQTDMYTLWSLHVHEYVKIFSSK